MPSMPRLAEVAAWRGTRPAAAAPTGSTGSSEQQQQHRGESPMSESQPSPPSDSQQQQQPPSSAQQQQQLQDDRRDPSSVLGRPPPSAAIYHGGYYTQEDVAQVGVSGEGEACGVPAGLGLLLKIKSQTSRHCIQVINARMLFPTWCVSGSSLKWCVTDVLLQVVAYAAARCIEVVPEIELPGHCVAALAAYPHLSCEH